MEEKNEGIYLRGTMEQKPNIYGKYGNKDILGTQGTLEIKIFLNFGDQNKYTIKLREAREKVTLQLEFLKCGNVRMSSAYKTYLRL